MQNLVVFIEPSYVSWDISLKGGNMILNRFCIDENDAFELFGVNYFKKLYEGLTWKNVIVIPNSEFKINKKGKENSYQLVFNPLYSHVQSMIFSERTF